MLGVTGIIVAILMFSAFANWRSVLFFCIIMALLQDPLRKLVPDQPVFFVVLVGVVFGAGCLGAWAHKVPFSLGKLFGQDRKINAALYMMLIIIFFETLNSFLQFGNPMMTAIGLLVYLLPLPAVIFARELAIRGGEEVIYKFMLFYLVCTATALTTVYLEYDGFQSPLFGQVGGNLYIYDKYVEALIVPHSGIFRASEIAAWHAMACACFALILVTVRKFSFARLFGAALLVLALVGLATLTGRRKAIIEVAVFASAYLTLWCILQKRAEKIGVFLAISALAGFGLWLTVVGGDITVTGEEGAASYYNYVERSKSVFSDAPERFVELGIAPVMWAYDSYGLFGAGIGTGTQGAQHFGRSESMGGAAEGGLGKITLELGIPGLVLSGWLMILVAIYLWRILRQAARISPRIGTLACGLFSFLIANVAGFSVATQAYSDIFILLILGWSCGFLLAIPVLVQRDVPILARQRALNYSQALG